jgi:sarcosine oxidase subunit gamma
MERDCVPEPSTSPQVVLADVKIASAWNAQGQRAIDAARRHFALALDETPNTMTSSDEKTSLWLGPQSRLQVSGAAQLRDLQMKRDALQAAGGALFDVSASRVAFAVRGARALDVLAAGCPLDLHPDVFPPGRCAQSVFARVSALYARAADGFVVLVPRSFGRDVWHGLCGASEEFGYAVEPERPWRAPHGL